MTPEPKAPDPKVLHDLAPTGTLRAAINLGNPVLAQAGPDGPTGVSVDLARALAARLGVRVTFLTFPGPARSRARRGRASGTSASWRSTRSGPRASPSRRPTC